MGSRGDVEPYVSLGQGLAADGYRVRIATLAPFEEVVRSHRLEFRLVSDPLDEFKESAGWVQWQSSGASWWRKLAGLRSILEQARPALLRTFDECAAACDGSTAILSAWTAFAGRHIADHLGVFHVRALLQPVTPTREFPHFLWPWSGARSGFFNRSTYPLAEAAIDAMLGGALEEWCRARKVPTVARLTPVIYGFSKTILPRPVDWPRDAHVTGYWWGETDRGWGPPTQLSAFLGDGTDVICVCHGVFQKEADPIQEALRCGAEAAGFRVLLVTGAGAIRCISEKSLEIDSAPYEWLFRRVRLVVHHGGVGTAAETLRAGCPSIVLPMCFDQPFWAAALERLGVAVALRRPHWPTVERVQDAVLEITGNPAYQRNAAGCAEQLVSENGVGAAVTILRRYLRAV